MGWTFRVAVFVAIAAALVGAARMVVNGRMGPVPEVDMSGKVVLITGASAGIGKETAAMLCGWGAHVVVGARTLPKAERAVEYMKAKAAADGRTCSAEVWKLDLASFASVREFADRFLATDLSLDVVIANAGIAGIFDEWRTVDGHEMTFQTNHLSHFLLINLLLPRLKASAPARVVVVSSDLHFQGTIDFQNLDSEREYKRFTVYQDTKLYNVLFSNELNRRLAGTGVVSNALHPGFVVSELGRDAPSIMHIPFNAVRWLIARGQVQGALTSVFVATSEHPDVASGGNYFDSARVHHMAPAAENERNAERLWRVSAAMVGLEGASFDPVDPVSA